MWKRKATGSVWLFCDGSTGALEGSAGGAPPAGGAGLAQSCAAAAVAYGAEGQILDWGWQPLPDLTNNEAEYAGLLLGLELAQRLGAQAAICVLDSEIVVGQMAGRFAVKSVRLRQWHERACAAVRQLAQVEFVQIPREWNRLADGLAGQAAIPWPALLAAIQQRLARTTGCAAL